MARRHVILLLGVLLAALTGCQSEASSEEEIDIGDPERGQELISEFGCGSCHTIAGVDGAHGRAAPPLVDWTDRGFVAGSAANEPENVAQFIQDPESVSPGSAMPNLDVSEEEARHIAAYLFTLD